MSATQILSAHVKQAMFDKGYNDRMNMSYENIGDECYDAGWMAADAELQGRWYPSAA